MFFDSSTESRKSKTYNYDMYIVEAMKQNGRNY